MQLHESLQALIIRLFLCSLVSTYKNTPELDRRAGKGSLNSSSLALHGSTKQNGSTIIHTKGQAIGPEPIKYKNFDSQVRPWLNTSRGFTKHDISGHTIIGNHVHQHHIKNKNNKNKKHSIDHLKSYTVNKRLYHVVGGDGKNGSTHHTIHEHKSLSPEDGRYSRLSKNHRIYHYLNKTEVLENGFATGKLKSVSHRSSPVFLFTHKIGEDENARGE